MLSRWIGVVTLAIYLPAATGWSQGFNPPPGMTAPAPSGPMPRPPMPNGPPSGPLPNVPMQGMPMQSVPMQNMPSVGGPTPGGPPAGQAGFGASPGFGGPQPGVPSQPARQNYADELTDFGVPPQSDLRAEVGAPTPLTIPGAHVITTAEMRQAAGTSILFVDVLAGPPHPSLPGALMMPGAGDGGSFDDPLQQRLWGALSQATQMNPDRPIAFFCAGSRCWESYNASLRAVRMGFKVVLWYRGGLASWQAAGLPMGGGGGAAPPPPTGRPGFPGAPG